MINEVDDSANILINKTIEIDSSYYAPFYIRGYLRLWDFRFMHFQLDTDKMKVSGQFEFIEGSKYYDTNLVNLAIGDLIKCIELKKNGAKLFPDSSCNDFFPDDYEIPVGWQSHSLEEHFLFTEGEYIVQGVLAIMTSKKKNQIPACVKWHLSYYAGFKKVKELIDRYCP